MLPKNTLQLCDLRYTFLKITLIYVYYFPKMDALVHGTSIPYTK